MYNVCLLSNWNILPLNNSVIKEEKKPNPKDQYFLNWYDTTEIFLNIHSENGN